VLAKRVICDGDISSMSQIATAIATGLAISPYWVGNGPKHSN
jgi:hypothetical protein